MEKMKVFVAVPKPRDPHPVRHGPVALKLVALEVSRDDMVASVKATLHGMEGIPPRRQRLVFARSALPDDDGTTLADHGVVESATIQLVEIYIQLFVRVLFDCRLGTITLFGVQSSDTVEGLRIRCQEQVDILLRPSRQRLAYGLNQMEDGRTLADYGVRDSTTITLTFSPGRWRQRNVMLDIEVTDTVGRIKERVEEAVGVPVACQSVYYHGKELADSRALVNEYGEALEWVHVECRRPDEDDTTKMTNKRDGSMVTETETVKRRTDNVEVATGPGEKTKKRRRSKDKPLAEMEAVAVKVVQRRRFRVYVIGPRA
ncbi:unnamed protein product [Alopecurus aequalis]